MMCCTGERAMLCCTGERAMMCCIGERAMMCCTGERAMMCCIGERAMMCCTGERAMVCCTGERAMVCCTGERAMLRYTEGVLKHLDAALEQAVSFDAYRLIRTARVHEFDGQRRICFPEKEAWNVYELFHMRHNLHKRAYQHRVACVCTHMIMKAMTLADTAGYIPVRACACLLVHAPLVHAATHMLPLAALHRSCWAPTAKPGCACRTRSST